MFSSKKRDISTFMYQTKQHETTISKRAMTSHYTLLPTRSKNLVK